MLSARLLCAVPRGAPWQEVRDKPYPRTEWQQGIQVLPVPVVLQTSNGKSRNN